jgi:hypothetical protein
VAIYHLHAQIISRGSGRSATSAAAYRAAEFINDQRTGLVFDFRRKRGVAHKSILHPLNAPSWVQDRAQLWNEVEKAEKRRDAQLAREMDIALPLELTLSQNIKLIEHFAQTCFVKNGMVADICVHNSKGNPHAHIMLTMREVTPAGFGKKRRDWNDKDVLEQWRMQWTEFCNRQLKMTGNEERIDHRTLVSQGISKPPTTHEGPTVRAIRLKRLNENEQNNRTTKEKTTMQQAKTQEALEITDPTIESPSPGYFISAWRDDDKQALDIAIAERSYETSLNKWLEPFTAMTSWFKSNLGHCWRIILPSGCVFDYGSQIKVTRGSWEEIRASMTMALKKGWAGIRISGTKEFAGKAYLQAVLTGFPISRIEGYKPSEHEKQFAIDVRSQILDARRDGFLKAKARYANIDSKSGVSELGKLLLGNILGREGPRGIQQNSNGKQTTSDSDPLCDIKTACKKTKGKSTSAIREDAINSDFQ